MVLEARAEYQNIISMEGHEPSVQPLGNGDFLLHETLASDIGLSFLRTAQRLNKIEDPSKKTRLLHSTVDGQSRQAMELEQAAELTPEQQADLSVLRGHIQAAFVHVSHIISSTGHQA
jgi:hypothetical protein